MARRAGALAEALEAIVDASGDDGLRWAEPGRGGFTLAFTPFDYQLQTAQTVLRRMRGRAILADEVGMGKTIEAGLVLSELRVRGMANRTLVLTPAGLVEQWREELERKFGLPTAIWRGGAAPEDRSIVLASIATARREPTRSPTCARALAGCVASRSSTGRPSTARATAA